MIVKVLWRKIAISVLNRKLRELWKTKGGMYVMDLPRQFFMIRFDLGGVFGSLNGRTMESIQKLPYGEGLGSEFDPLRDEIVTTLVWVRLSNIPVNFYHKEILLGIARGLGKPIKVDLTTLNFERARFVRVCLEVNLSKPLKGTELINGERYFVAYEGLSNICSACGLYGHLVHNCPRRVVEKAVEAVGPSAVETQTESRQAEDGFTMVRRAGRRPAQPASGVVVAAGGLKANFGRNLRDISRTANKENIITSNRFGNLEEDTQTVTGGEVAIFAGENKENEIISVDCSSNYRKYLTVR